MGRYWKTLALLLILLNLATFTYYSERSPSIPSTLQERLTGLEEENALMAQRLEQTNLSLEYYQRQAEFYRGQVEGLEARLNRSAPGGYTGTASMDAPSVAQKVEIVENPPFIERRVTQEGAILRISVEIKPGEGRVLVMTKPLMGTVFQEAANTAIYVAQNLTGKDLSGSDVIFSVEAQGEVPQVDGPSAGALMTLLAISAIQGKQPPQDITLTGTIERDGRVGEIGGVIEKAQAAKASGKRLILLPAGNTRLIQYTQSQREIAPGLVVIERRPRVIDAKDYIEKNVGIEVEYVGDIRDVLRYA